MIGTEYRAGAVQVLHHQQGLPGNLDGGEHLEITALDLGDHGCLAFQPESEQADVFGVHGVQRFCRFDCVLLPAGFAAKARDGRDRQLHPRFTHHPAGLYNLAGSLVLVHMRENSVAARFQAHVNHLKPQGSERSELLRCLNQDTSGRAVAGDPATLRKDFLDGDQNGLQI